MHEDLTVYQALREHILHKEGEITNEIIYMYVTYFALLSVGTIWNNWISLVTFIDLIVFQSLINSSQLSITKASLYIVVFFETTSSNNIHWELLHRNNYFQLAFSVANRNLGFYFRKFSSSILSVISFFCILFPTLDSVRYNFYEMSLSSIFQIIFAIILCVLTIYINKLYSTTQKDTSASVIGLQKAIEDFYKQCFHQSDPS